MFSYSISEWFVFFYIYCLFGWIFESTFVSLKKRKFINRGFLHGPAIPIYGEGAIMMLFATIPVKGNICLEFIFGMIGATALEYVVGALMEQVFKVKYWDYTGKPFNVNGYICLTSTIAWGFLSVLLAEVMHTHVEAFVLSQSPTVITMAAIIITIIFAIDTCISAKEAWDLRVILDAITKAKEEMKELENKLEEKIEEKLEETKEAIGERIEGTKEAIGERIEETREKLEESKEAFEVRKEAFKEAMPSKPALDSESIRIRLEESARKYEGLVEKFNGRKNLMLRRNPDATSKRFKVALENAKESMGINKK